MARQNRTYKLKVSPAGFDMIVESHAHLVRTTRTLLPYGVALHAALHHLDTLDEAAQRTAIREFPRFTLGGGRSGMDLFVGAPTGLSVIADRILEKWKAASLTLERPAKADIYLIALKTMLAAQPEHVLSAYSRVVEQSMLISDSPS